MKRTAILMMVLAGAVWAQTQAPSTPQPAAQPQGSTAAATPAPQPQGKLPPQAKTQEEYNAYQAAKQASTDAAAAEQVARDFAAKFPDSDLRVLLYRDAMHAFQKANNSDKMLEMGRLVLQLEQDDPEAMIGVAEVLTERTRDTDLDKQQRIEEASKLAQKALDSIDTGIVVPAGTPPETVAAYKSFLRSSAYAILGTQQFNQQKYKEAEDYFRKSIDAYPSQLDPIVVLRLALALDNQKRYQDALQEAYKAVDLTTVDTPVGTYARQERDRLIQLTGGIVPPPEKPAAGTATPAPPKN